MSLWDSISNAVTNGSGTPWGAPAQRSTQANPWDALTTGAGTPWGAVGQNGINAFADPVTGAASAAGFMGNPAARADTALFTGAGTPWAAGGQKSTEAFMEPVTHEGFKTKSGLTDYVKSLNEGQMDMVGLDNITPKTPDKPTLQTDPTQYKAPDYSDYQRAGQEQINTGLARSRNAMAAGMQKHGDLGGADTGLGFGDVEQSAQGSRGGLANAISQMQQQNQWGQMQAANQGMIDRYNNDYGNYQNAMNAKTANRDTSLNTLKTVGGLAGALYGG